MKYKYLFTFYFFVNVTLTACSKHGNMSPVDNGLKNDTNVYAAGATVAPNGYLEATYWRNGVPVILHPNTPGELTPSDALAVAIQGHDVFFVGYTSDSGNEAATIWKNGAESLLATNYVRTTATGICVKGNDVYVCGYSYEPTNTALCWKNGVAIDLEYAPGSSATAIATDGNDVYIAGNIVTPAGTVAVYWKNGKAIMLDPGNIRAAGGNSVYIDGTDVYVAGSAFYGPEIVLNPFVATYWKNGKATMVGDPTQYSYASFITVHGGDVHILGTLTVDNLDSPIYWKNGIVTEFGTGYYAFSAIAFNNNNSYFAGDSGAFGSYIKNGVKVILDGNGNRASLVNQIGFSSY